MLKQIILLPVGSYEYHGNLLPSETDALIANRVATQVHEKFHDSILLPPVNYGISTEHSGFPETITINNETYYSFIYKLIESISQNNSLIVIINGHGGNVNILKAIESEYNYAHSNKKVLLASIYTRDVIKLCEDLLGEYDAHAGSVESSLMSYYKYIKSDEVVVYEDSFVKKMPGSLRFFRTIEINPNGVIKDTNKLIINSSYGEKINDLIIDTVSTEIKNIMKYLNKIIT